MPGASITLLLMDIKHSEKSCIPISYSSMGHINNIDKEQQQLLLIKIFINMFINFLKMLIKSYLLLINGKIILLAGYFKTLNKFKFFYQDLILKLFTSNTIELIFPINKNILILNLLFLITWMVNHISYQLTLTLHHKLWWIK